MHLEFDQVNCAHCRQRLADVSVVGVVRIKCHRCKQMTTVELPKGVLPPTQFELLVVQIRELILSVKEVGA